ncbi:mitochondrial distribution and morphology [Dipsacomyces acuminosporus]|nr:mitochondrial distribution and morphology [Dipsacomyces acuminosporus]
MEQRQLRPIYDALDISDFDRARKECAKLLRKNPNHLSAKALLTFVLARSGDTDNALGIGQQVLSAPSALKNPHVQQGLSLAYRALGRPTEEIAVYNGALNFDPSNEQLHRKVFMAAARNRMYKEQHQTALQLNKMFKRDIYMWWVIVSLLLQARFAKESPSTKLHLTLAERMCEKALSEGRLANTEELRVYLEVLESQQKYDKMIEVLSPASSPLARKIENDPDLVSQHIRLLIKAGKHPEARDAAISSLQSRDNWIDYKYYIEAAILDIEKSDISASDRSSLVESVCDNLGKWSDERGRARGAQLAFVELAARLAKGGADMSSYCGAVRPLDEQIWKYVDQFQTKAICYSDIMPYVVASINSSLDSSKFHHQQIDERLDHARNSASESDDKAQVWVNLEKIRYLVLALTKEEDPQTWTLGVEAMIKFGLDSDAADGKWSACSDLVLLACQYIIQSAFLAFSAPENRGRLYSTLFKAVCILESGIKNNGNVFQIKLYAVRLYLYLSCYERAKAIYDSLNIKHIQHDTLGYLINGQGMSLGCFVPDLELCYEGASFYDRAHATIPRDIESVYSNGTYSNIFDFIEFQDNVLHSVQRGLTHRCALRGEVFEHGDVKDLLNLWEEADIDSLSHTSESLSSMYDNRDLKVMSALVPAELAEFNLEILTRPVPIPQTNWVQAFSLIPQIMHYIATGDVGCAESKSSELLTLVEADGGALMSSQDSMLARGVCQIATLYIRAVGGKENFEEELEAVVDAIKQRLPSNPEAPGQQALSDISSATIRNLSAASELFSYALVAKYALAAKRSPSASAVGFALSQLRKTALKSIAALRSWVDKSAQDIVDEAWLNPDDVFLSGITDFLCERRRSTAHTATKNCVSSWLRSIRNLTAQWERRT